MNVATIICTTDITNQEEWYSCICKATIACFPSLAEYVTIETEVGGRGLLIINYTCH